MEKLREWREANQISQKVAAGMFKMSTTYLSMIENGEREPSIKRCLKIQEVTEGAVPAYDDYLRKINTSTGQQ